MTYGLKEVTRGVKMMRNMRGVITTLPIVCECNVSHALYVVDIHSLIYAPSLRVVCGLFAVVQACPACPYADLACKHECWSWQFVSRDTTTTHYSKVKNNNKKPQRDKR